MLLNIKLTFSGFKVIEMGKETALEIISFEGSSELSNSSQLEYSSGICFQVAAKCQVYASGKILVEIPRFSKFSLHFKAVALSFT